MQLESWFVISALLVPVGYVVQDVVADAMTVEAVPSHGKEGRALSESEIKIMHITMQTIGRVAIVAEGISVSLNPLYAERFLAA